MDSMSLTVARAALRLGRGVWSRLPQAGRKQLEDRLFYVIFQTTRVENDAYGWRPPKEDAPKEGPPKEGPPDPAPLP